MTTARCLNLVDRVQRVCDPGALKLDHPWRVNILDTNLVVRNVCNPILFKLIGLAPLNVTLV